MILERKWLKEVMIQVIVFLIETSKYFIKKACGSAKQPKSTTNKTNISSHGWWNKNQLIKMRILLTILEKIEYSKLYLVLIHRNKS